MDTQCITRYNTMTFILKGGILHEQFYLYIYPSVKMLNERLVAVYFYTAVIQSTYLTTVWFVLCSILL